jgi:subtilisin family serine protease
MRRLRRIVTGTAIASLLALTMPPAAEAASRPLPQQWWFPAWAVNNKIWPTAQGQGVTVAVVDTGVQANLPDFSGAVLQGTDTTGGGGDGRTDTDSAAVPGHGTGMASLIVAQGHGTGFLGVAPKAKVLPIVADSANTVTQGIRFAADHNAKVISISQGAPGPCTDALQQAVNYAVQKGAIVVAASGDYGRTSNGSLNPANCAGVLAVGAIDSQVRPWSGTERQPYVAVAAPGANVGGILKDGQIHSSEGGTSQATALTSGGIALLWSKFPDESRTDILQRVFASLRDAGPKGKDDTTGYGVFRPARVLGAAVPHSAAYDQWSHSNGGASGRTHAAPKGFTPGDQGAGHKTWGILKVVLPVVGIGLLAVIAAIVMRSRQRGRAPAYQGQAPPQGQVPPGQGGPGPYQQGPPPSFGPSQNQGPPSGRPAFRPPPDQGPPPDRR